MKRSHFEAEHEIFRDSFRTFLQKEIAPHTLEWEEAGIVPKWAWKLCGENGFLGTQVDPQYGGAGVEDFRYEQILAEEMAYINEAGLMLSLHNSLCIPYITTFGTAAQKARYLPGCVSGDIILAVAMTEPGTGSDLASIRTRAEDKGDHYLLNGSKIFISNGVNSDLVIVAARTDPDNKYGLSLFLVEKTSPGFEVGRKLDKMGMRSQDTAELFFNDVKIPKENLLGQLHQGFYMLMQMLVPERLSTAISAVAAARSALNLTLAYTQERQAFGKPIAAFQNTRFKLAEIKTEVEIGEVYVDRLVSDHMAGNVTAVDAAQAKLWTTEMLGRVADACVQLHGGYGYMMEYPITRIFANARVSRIYAGTNEIMKEIIGKSMGC